MPTTCTIDFENSPIKVIYSGQLLRGTVHLKLSSEKHVREIFIKIVGKAQTCWSEDASSKKKTYKGNVEYLNDQVCLVGHTDGKNS